MTQEENRAQKTDRGGEEEKKGGMGEREKGGGGEIRCAANGAAVLDERSARSDQRSAFGTQLLEKRADG